MSKDYSKNLVKIESILQCIKKGSNKDYTSILQAIEALLEKIDQNTDELEIKTENINLNAEKINLNVDEVEDLLKQILAEKNISISESTPIQGCSGGVTNILIKYITLWDNEIGVEISKEVLYSTDLINFTSTPPSTDISIGACKLSEVDLFITDAQLVCGLDQVSNTKYKMYVREKYEFDNLSRVVLSKEKEYSLNGIDWVDTEPLDANGGSFLYSIGECPDDVVTPPCKENKSYQIKGFKGLNFDANKIYKYQAGVFEGVAGRKEVNLLENYEQDEVMGNGPDDASFLLVNPFVIAGRTADADIRISVIQECGYMPQEIDVIQGFPFQLQINVDGDNVKMDLNWDDVIGESSYEVWRYITSDGKNTAVKLATLPANTAIYSDTAVVPNTDYTYFVIGKDVAGFSVETNTVNGIINVITGSILLTDLYTPMTVTQKVANNLDFKVEAIYIP